ncbi:hypothetical protein DOTSEDRAFT_109763, partial [Dothistroma septosporum NZE10]
VTPRIIIHGGAGNITTENMPPKSYKAYKDALLSILSHANHELSKSKATALDIATYAVSLLELDPLFNAGRGAVYNTAGRHELEASVMVSNGHRKRGVGVMKVRRTKHPIRLAREMLIRGEQEDGGGALGHCQLEGETCERLAREWGLEEVRPSWFWTRRRWDEHRRGLGLSHADRDYEDERKKADEEEGCAGEEVREVHDVVENDRLSIANSQWDGKEYLPQGTVGAVVLDKTGTLCVATSTGGLTNKLPGRIGDTPTLGAGFWAEQWYEAAVQPSMPTMSMSEGIFSSCLPNFSSYQRVPHTDDRQESELRAVAMSGTGNGDSFLRVNAVRTAAAIARYASGFSTSAQSSTGQIPLQKAVTAVAGPGGQLQRSAEDRWQTGGEGEGGIIGIDLLGGKGKIVYDFNCGGMFRAWVDDEGKGRFELF